VAGDAYIGVAVPGSAEAGAVVEDSAVVVEDSAGSAVGEGLAVAVPEDDSDA
jgi:hypothetical protein